MALTSPQWCTYSGIVVATGSFDRYVSPSIGVPMEIYLYTSCTSCRNAEHVLRASGMPYQRRDFFKTGSRFPNSAPCSNAPGCPRPKHCRPGAGPIPSASWPEN